MILRIFPHFPTRCGLAIISGLAVAGAFPPLGWRWMILPGLVQITDYH